MPKGRIAVFQEKLQPENTRLVGWAALVDQLRVQAPVRHPCCVSNSHIRGSRVQQGDWMIFDKRYWTGEGLSEHLTFALKHEVLDLLVLKRIFEAVSKDEIELFVKAVPTGVANRRAWYLYELLTGATLIVKDVPKTGAVEILDCQDYFTGKYRFSKRQRVNDNLLGSASFCPIIRRTKTLQDYLKLGLEAKVRETIGLTGAHLISRAASFMLLADSRASFEIEGERPPRNRLERWGRAILQSGRKPLTADEIVRLHHIIIEDTRFVKPGLREDGIFLGERDHNGDPLPEFIGARPEDLQPLMDGLLLANSRMRESGIDPVLQAAATAFGFVYVHPLQDGNGRIHRCIIHHVLAERGFSPSGMVFPVSSVMHDWIDAYRTTLQSHTAPLMQYIDWRPTAKRNVEVLNETADLYRYFDATEAAEFLFSCVTRTVERDLPREIDYLRRHDEARQKIMNVVEMPDQVAEDLIRFIRQNDGRLPKKRLRREFKVLTDEEAISIEEIIAELFAGYQD